MQVSILPHGSQGDGVIADTPSTGPLRVVIAPQAFKGTLGPIDAAEAMADGVRAALPDALVDLRPIADGGDGTVDVLVRSGFERRTVPARGPTGEPVAASIARRGRLAVVELASACGLALLPGGTTAPMTSSTAGLGDAIHAVLADGVDELVVCVGGSASTDGGAGMLVALGAVLRDRTGAVVDPSGATLANVEEVNLSGLDPRLADVRVRVATDVASPLLGPDGAAAVFAPQKGATPQQVAALEDGLTHWADLLERATGTVARAVPGAGAAGGTAFAAIAALHASVVSGAAYVQEATGLAAAMADADLVVTGEGRLDEQSLMGKGTGAVAALARGAGVPVVAVCGSVDLEDPAAAGFAVVATLADHARDPWGEATTAVTTATRAAIAQWRDAAKGA